MSQFQPLVSVIMPVYNTELYIKYAISSILNQTYTNFEFIIINDGSSDNSVHIIQSFKDERIKLFSFDENKGIEDALNFGYAKAKGKYIARMDADDISLPKRLEIQVGFLEKNTDIDLIGSDIFQFSNQKIIDYRYYFNLKKYSKIKCLFSTPLPHPTILFRNTLIKDGVKYNLGYEYREDYKFFNKIFDKYHISTINKPLFLYRLVKKKNPSYHYKRKIGLLKIYKEQFKKLNWTIKEEDIFNHHQLITLDIKPSNLEQEITNIENWVLFLIKKNKISKTFKTTHFNTYLGIIYLRFVLYLISHKHWKVSGKILLKLPFFYILQIVIIFFIKRTIYWPSSNKYLKQIQQDKI